ncbi:nuclear transport factor 2 family protein [Mycobacterium sp. Aquia_216]|uniref:nuclear transport factor 2 family protein n=1 Tax=Mycobacterium sp. Aquia_216 TaxID=2991729 RepID=UPI00227D28A7|nr:nuclear transport factor 2 family protein [Mycobacterium sp. Aquia_216]WAJ45369.1 nuclear transport factor 2 family protein [Mycobacterium sp. Aquia_216]
MSDVLEITQLVNLYGLAVDSQRWQLFGRIFAADVAADGNPLWDGTGWYDDALVRTPVAGGSLTGYAASPGGPATRSATRRLPA